MFDMKKEPKNFTQRREERKDAEKKREFLATNLTNENEKKLPRKDHAGAQRRRDAGKKREFLVTNLTNENEKRGNNKPQSAQSFTEELGIPKGWEVKKLEEVLKLEYGKPLPNEKRVTDGDFPVYGANGLKGRSNVFYVDRKSIIVGRKGSAGEINLTEDKFWPLDVTYFVTFNENNYDLKFLFHLLILLDLPKLAKGVKPGINRNEVYDLDVSIPTLPEQKRIVAILDECFTAIDKAKANSELNLKNAKELFESYLQGDIKNGNWKTKTLNEISENLDNKRIPITKRNRKSGSIPYYGASGVVDYVADYIFDDDLLCVSEDGANLLARTYPIAFSITGKTWVNNHAHVLKFPSIITQKFVEIYINSIKIDDYVSGMAQPKLNQAMLNKIPIPIPSMNEQQVILKQSNSLRAETQKLEMVYNKKIADLEELKKSVLQKAFAGELARGAVNSYIVRSYLEKKWNLRHC